jgi:hypothetical protein
MQEAGSASDKQGKHDQVNAMSRPVTLTPIVATIAKNNKIYMLANVYLGPEN